MLFLCFQFFTFRSSSGVSEPLWLVLYLTNYFRVSIPFYLQVSSIYKSIHYQRTRKFGPHTNLPILTKMQVSVHFASFDNSFCLYCGKAFRYNTSARTGALSTSTRLASHSPSASGACEKRKIGREQLYRLVNVPDKPDQVKYLQVRSMVVLRGNVWETEPMKWVFLNLLLILSICFTRHVNYRKLSLNHVSQRPLVPNKKTTESIPVFFFVDLRMILFQVVELSVHFYKCSIHFDTLCRSCTISIASPMNGSHSTHKVRY